MPNRLIPAKTIDTKKAIKPKVAIYAWGVLNTSRNFKNLMFFNLSTNEKSFEQVITEMMYLNNLGYNVYAEVDGVKISTRVLKTTEELVEYYNFRKNDVFPTTTNAKIMARASRKLEKQKIKNMI